MEKQTGLYVTLLPDGRIKKILTDRTGEDTVLETSIADEVIFYSELDYVYYMQVVTSIEETSFFPVVDGEDVFEEVDMRVFDRIVCLVQDMLPVLYENNPVTGLLLSLQLSDFCPPDDGTAMYAYNAREAIVFCLKQVVHFQTAITNILDDLSKGVPVDIENKYFYLQSTQFSQIFNYDGEVSTQYYFRSETDYCRFLLLHFMANKPNVALCKCCGRFFIPKTKKKTLYCDRVIKDGKTCKEIAPSLRHKMEKQTSQVLQEFDRTKQRMYRRLERTGYGKKETDKDLTRKEYDTWLENATIARNLFLRGEITEKEALETIVVP